MFTVDEKYASVGMEPQRLTALQALNQKFEVKSVKDDLAFFEDGQLQATIQKIVVLGFSSFFTDENKDEVLYGFIVKLDDEYIGTFVDQTRAVEEVADVLDVHYTE